MVKPKYALGLRFASGGMTAFHGTIAAASN